MLIYSYSVGMIVKDEGAMVPVTVYLMVCFTYFDWVVK